MIQIKRFTEGLLGSNTYLVWDAAAKDGFVVDAGNPASPVAEFVRVSGIKVKYIVITHSHYDHILYIDDFSAAFPEAVTAMHPADDRHMDDPRLNCSILFGSEHRFPHAGLMLSDGDRINAGDTAFEVMNTPGHTGGSICLFGGGYLLSGDVLFYDSFGRTDLGDGDMEEMGRSLDRLFELPDDTVVLPGHGTRTTVGREKRENPFLYMR